MPKHLPIKNSATKRAPPAILSSTSDEECQEPCPKRPRDSAQRPPTRPESSSSSSENLSPSASPPVTQEAPSRTYSPCADCLYVSYYWIKIILYASIPANDHWLMVIWFCICDMLGRLVSPIEYDQ